MSKRLYRSRVDCKIGGVCAGLADYFNIDPTIVRIIAILLVFADGIGLLGYIVAWIVIPRRPIEPSVESGTVAVTSASEPKEKSAWNIALPGIILIVIGLLFLIKNSYWWFDMGDLWPVILIIIGILMLIKRGNSEKTSGGNQVEGKVE